VLPKRGDPPFRQIVQYVRGRAFQMAGQPGIMLRLLRRQAGVERGLEELAGGQQAAGLLPVFGFGGSRLGRHLPAVQGAGSTGQQQEGQFGTTKTGGRGYGMEPGGVDGRAKA